MKDIKDYLPYYIGQNMVHASHHEPQFEPYVLTVENLAEAIEFWDLPILRRLSDMTEEEMKSVWEVIFQKPFHNNGSIRWIDNETRNSCKRWVLRSGVERVGIELNGFVWADSDLANYKFNPNLVFHYLLKQGFDLFNLIDNNLAVDAKTLPK